MLTALLFQDFLYSAGVAFFFILSSIVLAADNSGTKLELSAVVRQPLYPFVVPASFAPPHLPPPPPQVFGFVASVFFIADVIVFLRTCGFPFKKDTKEELINGVAAAQAPPPESEPLGMSADAAE